ncbi:MAG: hypothetical protein MUE46_18285, partial [Xanthomonadales bacterium]|nr:hypothetical protein [Xanthomonadales bacterium]
MSVPLQFENLVSLCHGAHEELFHRASRVVDAHLVVRNWLFGCYIAEFEQLGADRAHYGARLAVSIVNCTVFISFIVTWDAVRHGLLRSPFR